MERGSVPCFSVFFPPNHESAPVALLQSLFLPILAKSPRNPRRRQLKNRGLPRERRPGAAAGLAFPAALYYDRPMRTYVGSRPHPCENLR
jgi:hypothetical protein